VKTIGDALMLAFDNPAPAIPALRRLFEAASVDATMPLIRAGVHHGSAVEDEHDYFGAAVNLAARVAAHAAGGQLLATTGVALAARDAGEIVTHVGAVVLRNIAEPVDLYEIDFQPTSDTAVDPVCAMKVPTTGPYMILLRHADRDVWFCGMPCVARYAAAPDRYR
jgi:adenylate cyclase